MSAPIKIWFQAIRNEETRAKALKNMRETDALKRVSNPRDALNFGFNWASSPEGREFWQEVYRAIH